MGNIKQICFSLIFHDRQCKNMTLATPVPAPVESAAPETTPETAAPPRPPRLMSLDALRGFVMFWITGGEWIVPALAKVTGSSFLLWFAEKQLNHVPWEGCAAEDLIFPVFLFLAGVSIPFSIGRRQENGEPRWRLSLVALRRAVLLIFLGLVYNGLLRQGFTGMRYASVLGLIGIAWFFATLIFLNTRVRGQVIWTVGILLAYWAALKLIPVPGVGAGVLTPQGSLCGYLDRHFLPGVLVADVYDNEGLIAPISGAALALIGALAGRLLRNSAVTALRKVAILAGAGLAAALLAWGWGHWFPIVKNMWTSSFCLYAAGWGLMLLALFYLVIDVWQIRKWAFPFVLIGANALIIYIAQTGLIDFRSTTHYLFDWPLATLKTHYGEPVSELVFACLLCVVQWGFLYFLYRKKVFIRA